MRRLYLCSKTIIIRFGNCDGVFDLLGTYQLLIVVSVTRKPYFFTKQRPLRRRQHGPKALLTQT